VGVSLGGRPFSQRILQRMAWHGRGSGGWLESCSSGGDVFCRLLLLFVRGFGVLGGGRGMVSLVSSSIFVIVVCIVTGCLWIVVKS
jgi:hypothetical protein